MSDALLSGRTVAALRSPTPNPVSDALFAADRVDGQTFEGVHFTHCTFANVSFREARLVSCTFENCAFVDCYFRKTVFDSSRVLGCKFVTCNFPKTQFLNAAFVYPEFRGSTIAYDDFETSLPDQPNLRRHVADNLAREAEAAGLTRDARRYRIQANRALERYLWNGATGADEWSRAHFPGLGQRLAAGFQVFARWANGLIWGYGERGVVLVRNAFLLAFVLFPFVFYLLRDDLEQRGGDVGVQSYFLLSVDSILNGSGFSGVEATTTLARSAVGAEVFLGLVIIGLGIASILRWVTRR